MTAAKRTNKTICIPRGDCPLSDSKCPQGHRAVPVPFFFFYLFFFFFLSLPVPVSRGKLTHDAAITQSLTSGLLLAILRAVNRSVTAVAARQLKATGTTTI